MAGSELWKEYGWLIIVLVVGIIIVCLLGWAWVNLWEWGNRNVLLGFTSPVNKSVWEMSKIVIYPLLLFFVVLYASAYHALRNPAVALLCATAASVLFIWFWFYIYTWFNPARSNLGANIAIWILGVILAMIVLFLVFTAKYLGDGANYACIAIYLILVILWSIFTYAPPCKNCAMWWHKGGDDSRKAINKATNLDDEDGKDDEKKGKHKKKEGDCHHSDDEDYKKKKGKKHWKNHHKGNHHAGYDSDSSTHASSSHY